MASLWGAPARCGAVVAALLALAPAAVQASYWEPGANASPGTHTYTVCDTIRLFCHETSLEFVAPALHGGVPYWVVLADAVVLAGFPPDAGSAAEYAPGPWRITGEPERDMELLAHSQPPGIPALSYVMLYDGEARPAFADGSRTLADSLRDTVFGINRMMDGPGPLRTGAAWGDMVVTGSADGLHTVEYAGEGSASFLVDPQRPAPLAGVYVSDRRDPHIRATMWFYDEPAHMDMLLGKHVRPALDYSGPDSAMRAGGTEGLSWSSDTYTVSSFVLSPHTATIRGHADGAGELLVEMPAFGGEYTFWQGGARVHAAYNATGGVLAAAITHGGGSLPIAVHSTPSGACTGDCLRGMVVRAWDGASAIVYGGGYHGSVRLVMAAGDPNGAAPAACPPGSVVTVDFDDMAAPGRPPLVLPHATTYESDLDVTLSREGSAVRAVVSGGPSALTLRMPAMAGSVAYESDGEPSEPAVEAVWHDTVTATLWHPGGDATYTATADGPTAWGRGLSIPSGAEGAGAVWCGGSEPVNAAVARDSGPNRQDCGLTKFRGGWNEWC